jgi:HAD superfamily hydrolase (TIGR01484 family)
MSRNGDKKIIFFDIDGTLVSHAGGRTHVPESAEEAVAALRRNGHTPAIATARNLAMTRGTAAFFGIDVLVCCNGAHVLRGEETLYETYLDEGFSRIFREEIAPHSPRSYAVNADRVYTDMVSDALDAFIVAQAGFDCKRPIAAMRRAHLAYAFTPLSRRAEFHNVDVLKNAEGAEFRPAGVSKWSGILKAAESAGFGPADVVTVGDGLNDVEMVRNAPLGIAVGGAAAELKAAADFVAGDIDEDGLLNAFRFLGLA